jgi:hypothetical protein
VKALYVMVMGAVVSLLMSGCVAAQNSAPSPTKETTYPAMYQEAPHSILILPPINESPDVEAKGYYMTTMEELFAQWGYYVFPTQLTSEILKQQGVYDTELLYDGDATKFKTFFGADAVLFTTIKEWEVTYLVVSSSLAVDIAMEIRSTTTNQVLWSYRQRLEVDLSGNGGSSTGLTGLLIKAVSTAINTASADYVDYAKRANARLIYALPAGPYSPYYMMDQNMIVLDQTSIYTQ